VNTRKTVAGLCTMWRFLRGIRKEFVNSKFRMNNPAVLPGSRKTDQCSVNGSVYKVTSAFKIAAACDLKWFNVPQRPEYSRTRKAIAQKFPVNTSKADARFS